MDPASYEANRRLFRRMVALGYEDQDMRNVIGVLLTLGLCFDAQTMPANLLNVPNQSLRGIIGDALLVVRFLDEAFHGDDSTLLFHGVRATTFSELRQNRINVKETYARVMSTACNGEVLYLALKHNSPDVVEDRMLYVAFTNEPVNQSDLHSFFSRYGIIEKITSGEQVCHNPWHAELTFSHPSMVSIVLGGQSSSPFIINGNEVWAIRAFPKTHHAN